MPRFLIHHRHAAARVRRRVRGLPGPREPAPPPPTLASCASGGHAIWWTVEAATEADALALLPFFVAERSTVAAVSEVEIP